MAPVVEGFKSLRSPLSRIEEVWFFLLAPEAIMRQFKSDIRDFTATWRSLVFLIPFGAEQAPVQIWPSLFLPT